LTNMEDDLTSVVGNKHSSFGRLGLLSTP